MDFLYILQMEEKMTQISHVHCLLRACVVGCILSAVSASCRLFFMTSCDTSGSHDTQEETKSTHRPRF